MKFTGAYRGIVIDTRDPANQNRIRVNIPTITGDSTSEWVPPMVNGGYVDLPSPGSQVWILFEGGDVDFPLWLGTVGTNSRYNNFIGRTENLESTVAVLLGTTSTIVTTTTALDERVTELEAAAGSVSESLAVFSRDGDVTVTTGDKKYLMPYNATLVGARAAVGVAPTGADILVDVRLNGSASVFSSPAGRVTVPAGSYIGPETTAFSATPINFGDYLTVNIDQIGSTIGGADLTVYIRYTAT